MTSIVASSPGKVILFGEHGVHRQQPNITTAIDLRTLCRVTVRPDEQYSFRYGVRYETGIREQLIEFKQKVDTLRETHALDDIVALVRADFYAPARYVMSHLVTSTTGLGLDVEWHSDLPMGSGLGSGAAASCAMVQAAFQALGCTNTLDEVIFMAWQGDAIAHGGYGSSLDSSTCALGGFLSYTLEEKAKRLPFQLSVPIIIGDTLVEHRTNEVNTHIRKWLAEAPARMQVFRDMGYLLGHFMHALETNDFKSLGHVMNLHQLLQEKMGTAIPESNRLIEAAISSGALGAKISGSGGGGIVIALVLPDKQAEVAAAIDAAGGKSYVVSAGVQGTRLETHEVWEAAVHQK